MTKVPRVEVITSVERRRRWSRSEKERLVAASFEEGVTASDIAREAGIHVSQLFRWRKELCQAAAPERTALVPIEVVPVAPAPDSRRYLAAGKSTGSPPSRYDRDRPRERCPAAR